MGNEVGKLLDTVFSIPGMSNLVKLDLKKITLKQALVLSHVIERGIVLDAQGSQLLSGLSKSELEELKQLSEEILEKTGLKDLNANIKGLTSK